MRRVAWVLGIIAVAWLFAPSRVAKLTWSWPNPDGVTATSETRWCLVAPKWLPIRYPRWSEQRVVKQIEAIGLQCSDCIIWRVGYTSLKMESGYSTRLPKSAPPGTVGWHGDSKNYETFDGLDIVPENIDKLCDWTLDPPSPYMTFAPHTPPYSTSKQKEKGK